MWELGRTNVICEGTASDSRRGRIDLQGVVVSAAYQNDTVIACRRNSDLASRAGVERAGERSWPSALLASATQHGKPCNRKRPVSMGTRFGGFLFGWVRCRLLAVSGSAIVVSFVAPPCRLTDGIADMGYIDASFSFSASRCSRSFV